jgi:RimJ/RimL family protein N-acetyltransferase
LDIPTQLETERLVVRRYAKGDGQGLYLLLETNDNRHALKEHVNYVSTVKTDEDAEIEARKRSAEWDARDRFVMGIWMKKENRYIGEIWIEPKIWDVPSFEIGWFLDRGYQGKGIATEAVLRSLFFLFNDLNAHKVIAITRDCNDRSRKLADRVGFRKEGHLRECGVEDGKRYGLLYYGMLKSELAMR